MCDDTYDWTLLCYCLSVIFYFPILLSYQCLLFITTTMYAMQNYVVFCYLWHFCNNFQCSYNECATGDSHDDSLGRRGDEIHQNLYKFHWPKQLSSFSWQSVVVFILLDQLIWHFISIFLFFLFESCLKGTQ